VREPDQETMRKRTGNGEQTPAKRGLTRAAAKPALESIAAGAAVCEGIASIVRLLLGRYSGVSEQSSRRDRTNRRISNS